MNISDVMMVRIYTTESSAALKEIVKYIKEEAQMKGITIFRAISGFGQTGEHSANFLDISLDLPLVIEFFDTEEKVLKTVEHLSSVIKSEHMVFWKAQTNS